MFAAALCAAVWIADGNLGALRRLPRERPAPPPTSPTAPTSSTEAGPDVSAEPAPPLPPRPDLTPAPRVAGGAPISIPSQTVEDTCVAGSADSCQR